MLSAALFGSLGAILAMQLLRHKTNLGRRENHCFAWIYVFLPVHALILYRIFPLIPNI